MKEAVLVLLNWTHILAAVAWIGGIAAILFVVLPASRKTLGGDAQKFMAEIGSRFTPMANLSIGMLILTGALMVLIGQSPLDGAPGKTRAWALGLKILLVLAMAAIHFYRNLFLVPKIARVDSEPQKAGLRKLSLNLVKANFGATLAVLLLSSMQRWF